MLSEVSLMPIPCLVGNQTSRMSETGSRVLSSPPAFTVNSRVAKPRPIFQVSTTL